MNETRVRNFLWKNDAFVPDGAQTIPDDFSAVDRLFGQFALHTEDMHGAHLLLRDALGVNKLFYAIDPEGQVHSSNFLIDLVRRGIDARRIWSVPSGHRIRIVPAERRFSLEKWSTLRFNEEDVSGSEMEIEAVAARIRDSLGETFRRIADVVRGRPLFVTLSGGLDSTTIATLAREWIGEFVAVTFAVDGPGGSSTEGGDLFYAEKVAKELGVKLQVIAVSSDDLATLLDPVLVYGQDWRDFNVHCGLVNAAIGRAIGAGSVGDARPVLLTGDTMNELVSDYSPVEYGGATYYDLPNISPGRLRRFLVGGLDSGDREIGIFAHYGLDTIQPYALSADAYVDIPASWLDRPGAKQDLVKRVMGTKVPSFIYQRPKVRAQVGSSKEVGGTMAALLSRGITAESLKERFRSLFSLDAHTLASMIRSGFYRSTSTYPGDP